MTGLGTLVFCRRVASDSGYWHWLELRTATLTSLHRSTLDRLVGGSLHRFLQL